MLFSVLIGLLATVYFVARAAVIKLKFLVSGKKAGAAKKTAQPFVVYCEWKQYITVFKPVLDEFEKRQIPLLYYTSVEDDPAFSRGYSFVSPEFIGEGNTAFARLNFLEADVCLMTTPGLGVYQLKRSKGVAHYAHILHMVSDATMYRLFGLDYFDSVLLSADYQKKDIRAIEKLRGLPEKQLVTVGCPYLDTLSVMLGDEPDSVMEKGRPFTVLVSPSWGANALLSKYGERLLDPLAATGFHIIVRPHPQSKKSETDILENLRARYAGTPSLEWDFERDNIHSFARSDIMISDFSGVIFDYVFLCDRPFLYVNQDFDLRPYDADDLDTTPWQFSILPEIGKELREQDFADIGAVLKSISDSSELKENRAKAKAFAWQHIGESGRRTADFMISVSENLRERSVPRGHGDAV